MANRKLMIIGLDAATLRLVEPWAAEGKLPNLQRFMQGAAVGELDSTIPAASPASWSTFATGVNPGGHGMLNFVQLVPDSYNPQFFNASNRPGKTFWEIAGEQGLRSGIINVPITYPPRPCKNGFVVGCLLSPRLSPQMVSPPEFFKELMEASPNYRIDVEASAAPGRDVRELFVDRTLEAVAGREQAAVNLYRKHRPDLFCVVFTEADRVCHYYWNALEAYRAGRLTDEHELKFGKAIEAVYQRMDQAVGALLAEIDDDTDVLMLSDHGAGPVRKGLNVRLVLANAGLLAQTRPGLFHGLAKRALYTFVRLTPKSVHTRLKNMLPGLSRQAAGLVVETGVDWNRTLAYPCGYTGGVFVNLKGRQPQGCVDPADYEAVRDRIILALSDLVDPETGKRIMRKVYRREEAWGGECLDRLPDVVMEQEDEIYDTPLVTPPGAPTDKLFYPLPPSTASKMVRDGGHTRDGLIMAKGPRIQPGRITGARMLDIAPTVLALLGCKIPGRFEGKVLTQVFADQVEAQSMDGDRADDGQAASYTTDDQQAVESRLRGLGYI